MARAQILDTHTGRKPTQESFAKLLAEEEVLKAGLLTPMRAVQERLARAWSKLQLPSGDDASSEDLAALHQLIEWDPTTLPTPDQLVSCEMQAAKIECYAAVVAPFMSSAGAEELARMGSMLGSLLNFQAVVDGQTAEEMRIQADQKAAEAVALLSSGMAAAEEQRLTVEARKEEAIYAARVGQEAARRERAQIKEHEDELESVRNRLKALEDGSEPALVDELADREDALKAQMASIPTSRDREIAEMQARTKREKEELLAKVEHERAQLLADMEEEKQEMLAQFERERQQMADEVEIMRQARKENATAMLVHKTISKVHTDVLRDRKELEDRQQAEVERQAR